LRRQKERRSPWGKYVNQGKFLGVEQHKFYITLSLGAQSMKRFQRNNGEVTQVHQQNILVALQRRIEAAKARNDLALVNQLEQEVQQVKSGSGVQVITQAHKASSPQVASRDVSVIHRQNLLSGLQRRLEVAKSNSNQQLVAQLEQELRQLA
jgi:hypothetical protein